MGNCYYISLQTTYITVSHSVLFCVSMYTATFYSNLISRSSASIERLLMGVMITDFKREQQVILKDERNFQIHQMSRWMKD